jgi:hypothetical protein
VFPNGLSSALLLLAIGPYLIAQPATPEGTRRMAERLERIAQEARPEYNPFLSDLRVPLFEQWIAREQAQPHPSQARLINLKGDYARELLQAGQSLDSARQYEQVLELHQTPGGVLYQGRRDASALRNSLALAWLRLGEQENCISNHTSKSCILPIEPAAFHSSQRGSQQAIQVLLEQLSEHPGDLQARWLLNVACMTLGKYPNQVPEQFLIPPSTFDSPDNIGRFEDVAGPLGLAVPELSGGCITEDFDGDGDLDLVVSSMGLKDQLRYFRNNSDGTFTEATAAAGLQGEVGGLNILQTDYDNDGAIDILVLRGGWFGREGCHPKSLLRNLGNGSFEDVTEAAGLLSPHPSQTAAWLDYDGDGWVDVFFGHESQDDQVHPCELYHNQHDGTFRNVSSEVGVDLVGWVKGVCAGDFDNDGRPDLYVSRLGQSNVLLRNAGPASSENPRWRFEDVTDSAGVGDPVFSFPTWFFDYDNDGWLDIFVSGYRAASVGDVAADYLGLPHRAETPRLYRNLGNGRFENRTADMNLNTVLLGMGANYGDLDNDGWLDFYIGTGEPDLAAIVPNRMFRNTKGQRFVDVTTSGGFGHLQKGHGIAFADLDEDGDQDIYTVLGGAYPGDRYGNVLFENPGHGNGWVKLRLEGVQANRAAIGARITIVSRGPQGILTTHRTVGSGGSFGASSFRQEIGLGNSTHIHHIEIRWPGRNQTQTIQNPPINCTLQIRENDPQWKVQQPTPFDFHTGTAPHHH